MENENLIIVPRNEKYVRPGVPRIQVPYSIIDNNMKPKEKKLTFYEKVDEIIQANREALRN